MNFTSMAQASINSERSSDKLDVNSDVGHFSDTAYIVKENAGRSKKKTKFDLLQDSFTAGFSSLKDTLERFSSKMEMLVPNSTSRGYDSARGRSETQKRYRATHRSRSRSSDSSSCRSTCRSRSRSKSPCNSIRHADSVSLQPRRTEKRGLLSDSDSVSSVETKHLSEKNQSILVDLFGEDAKPQDKKRHGISLESSQKELLESSWHCKSPDKLSSFQENLKDYFPLSEESEKFLNIPSLDPIVESLLVKKHGSKKATFSKTGASLVSQPFKGIEKSAYSGQLAAKMGIASLLYIQQGLGSLLSSLNKFSSTNVSSEEVDRASQTVKDIFAMSQKSMDQMARCGAFHQIVRRKATIADTDLLDFVESSDLQLPLSSDGVFGNSLEDLLQQRKDRIKKLEDLLPNSKKKHSSDRKRKSSDYSRGGKRYKHDFHYDRTDSFRDNRKAYRTDDRNRGSKQSSRDDFKKPANPAYSRGGGKSNRK